MISQTLLPKQGTPFIIDFPGIDVSQVGSIRMEPLSVLMSASADPVIEIENQQYKDDSGASVTGQLFKQSNHPINIAYVLSTLVS